MGSVEAMQAGSKDRYFQANEDNAKKLVAGEEVELKNPPANFIDGGYLVESKSKKESK